MTVLFLLIAKLIPLYIVVLFGFLAGRFSEVKKETVANLLIYIITPVVVFGGVFSAPITAYALFLPILFFVLAASICVLYYFISGLFFKTSERNILAYAAGVGNVGYFGLPIGLALFGPQQMGVMVLIVLGFILYEHSLGFFIAAKGQFSSRQALKKLLKLPALHAFFFALFCNIVAFPLSPFIDDLLVSFRGAYTVLGMMLVGLGLSQIKSASIDYMFSGLAFVAKFLIWPIVIMGIIFIDSRWLNFYDASIYQIMFLMSIVPLASNTVAFATKFNLFPEKSAFTVLLSTLFALIYIPIVIFFATPFIARIAL